LEILNAVLNTNTSALMEMHHLLVNPKYKELWGKSYAIKLDHLTQGISGIGNGTNTIIFTKRDAVSIDQRKDITYGRMCDNYCPEKTNPNCTCLTVGSNCITYPRDCGTPTVAMVTVKIHLNSVISTKSACYCTIDLKDFYLNTPMAPMDFLNSPKSLHKSTNYMTLPMPTVSPKSKSKKECMASLKQASSCKSSLKNT
jgi:hypothetical protein